MSKRQRRSEGLWDLDGLTYRDHVYEAADKWRTLSDEGSLSLPPHLGRLVIVVSGAMDKKKFKSDRDVEISRRNLLIEAERIKELRSREAMYDTVDISSRPSKDDVDKLFSDPEVSGLVLIGHGGISRIWMDGGGDYSWLRVSRNVNYLKQGKIEQMMCGHFARLDLHDVPMGTFAVSSLTNLFAATGDLIDPPHGEDRSHLFSQVYPVDSLDVIGQIDAVNLMHGKMALNQLPAEFGVIR